MNRKELILDIAMVGGFLLTVAGTLMIHRPAGLILAGLELLLYVGIALRGTQHAGKPPTR